MPLLSLAIAAMVLCSACGGVKLHQIKMFEEVGTGTMPVDSLPDLRIMPLDILAIHVSGNDPASVAVFHQFRMQGGSATGAASGEGALGIQEGYRVDEEGHIYLPFIGQVRAQGKTLNELRQELTSRLEKYILNISVQLRFMSFRVTLMGEVVRPSTYLVPNERLTLLEAVGMAGDFTPYANRKNVLVIRERNGIREFARVNTQDRTLFRSPYFYLSPNDMVYVEPLKAKQYATQGDFLSRYSVVFLSLLSFLTILATTR
jgi:polysaccharide export outer membrane protein